MASLDTATSLPADFEFDREISTIARLEARYLRQQLLGNVKAFPCAICGRTLPVALLVTAHIKTRSECNEAEKGDVNVVMSNCLFGCDALYERGLVTVDANGMIRLGVSRWRRPLLLGGPRLPALGAALLGRFAPRAPLSPLLAREKARWPGRSGTRPPRGEAARPTGKGEARGRRGGR